MITPIQEEHYGAMVWTNKEADATRKDECLCLNCAMLSNCPTAKGLYEICKDNDMAMMITRCKQWKPK